MVCKLIEQIKKIRNKKRYFFVFIFFGLVPFVLTFGYTRFLQEKLVLDYNDASFNQEEAIEKFQQNLKRKFDQQQIDSLLKYSPESIRFKMSFLNKVNFKINSDLKKEALFICWFGEDEGTTLIKNGQSSIIKNNIKKSDLENAIINIRCFVTTDPPFKTDMESTVQMTGNTAVILNVNSLSSTFIFLTIFAIISGFLAIIKQIIQFIVKGISYFVG